MLKQIRNILQFSAEEQLSEEVSARRLKCFVCNISHSVRLNVNLHMTGCFVFLVIVTHYVTSALNSSLFHGRIIWQQTTMFIDECAILKEAGRIMSSTTIDKYINYIYAYNHADVTSSNNCHLLLANIMTHLRNSCSCSLGTNWE